MDGLPRLNQWPSLWTLSPSGIYFVPAEAPRSLRYFDFATRQLRPIFEGDKDFEWRPVSLSRWPLDPLFPSWRSEQRHHARRSLSIAFLKDLQITAAHAAATCEIPEVDARRLLGIWLLLDGFAWMGLSIVALLAPSYNNFAFKVAQPAVFAELAVI